MMDNNAVILTLAKQISTLATELATEGAKCPAHARIVEMTDQIAATSVEIQKAAGGWNPEMAKNERS
jgi:hypothetical protein